jgi:hypothetical protein
MSDNSFKPWQLPLSAEAKARAISHINERHEMLLALGPVAFAAMGRHDKARYAHIQLLNHGYDAQLYTEPAPD